jgi:methyl-accepting chemotaxis protein
MTNSSSRSELVPVITSGVLALIACITAAAALFLGYGAVACAAIGVAGLGSAANLLLLAGMGSRASATAQSLADVQRKLEAAVQSAAATQEAHACVIARITEVGRAISDGDLEARIVNVAEEGALAEVQYCVNDMIDRCDAFVREATASLDAVCKNIYYRRIVLGGLNGAFRIAATNINNAVDSQRAHDEERRALEQAQAASALEQQRVIGWLSGGLKRLAQGDLTCRLSDAAENYLAVQQEFNEAMARLQETMQATADAARDVTSAAAEISASTTDLSERTEQQAAGLEETSASMEQISATVKKNAENAREANALTADARQVADRGSAVLAATVEAMSRIEESSRKIGDIIGVIDEIARQTNLLALNAAVEAARAGEAGRGFAVVASEVRALAQRSSQAAKDIKDLITNSSDQVQQGVELVNRTGVSLNDIAAAIKKASLLVADIATASSEQAIGIDQVNKALTQMDEVTQQNSALVEENAATAKTLESQSAAMGERVAFFRIGHATAGAAAAPRFAAARPLPAKVAATGRR